MLETPVNTDLSQVGSEVNKNIESCTECTSVSMNTFIIIDKGTI